jgi:hypothetical protein
MLTALMLAASLLTAAPAVDPGADLSVDLDARGMQILVSVRYSVSVTNHGPDPVTSATVTVQLEYPGSGAVAPCALPTHTTTMTCTFGTVPVDSTVTATSIIFLSPPAPTSGRPVPVNATATRTASTPTDPNAANDADTRTCWFYGLNPPQVWPPPMSC